MQPNQILRSMLFVPGDRPDRFAKALDSNADAVIIDLEDAVAANAKTTARQHIAQFARNQHAQHFWVRINDASTDFFADDLKLCVSLPNLSGIILPKAEHANDLQALSTLNKPVIPIIESAQGVLNLATIASLDSIYCLSFGALDLSLDLGLAMNTAGAEIILNNLRTQLLLHSRINHLAPPIDTVYADIKNDDGLQQFAQRAKDMGFAGMLSIHPRQIPIIHQVFTPSPAQLDLAHKVVEYANRTGSNAFSLDGQMVDQPIIEMAKQLLRTISE